MPLDANAKPENVRCTKEIDVGASMSRCPLYPQEQTLAEPSLMSPIDPQRTWPCIFSAMTRVVIGRRGCYSLPTRESVYPGNLGSKQCVMALCWSWRNFRT